MSSFDAGEHPYVRQVLARAARDAAFRARLLQFPHAAIRDETGIDVPPDLRIRFVLQPGSDDLAVEILDGGPDDAPAMLDDELSLDDLEAAAGGTGGSGGDPESPW